MTTSKAEWQRENGIHRGKGVINLPLAILVKAKETDHTLWQDFVHSGIYRKGSKNCDSLEVACWVGEYLTKDLKEAK